MNVQTSTRPRILQLPPAVANKIAAGEVIERPASVVKELLENSLDALATRIDVDILQGGSELIRVVDDGEGIAADDLELAVSPHATSKIRSADDLFHVHTMGFRGEALASIAEVSRFRIRSRPADQDQGTELIVNGGIVKQPQPCGCPVGTQIEVRELFLNTPVRRKFLRKPATEFSHILEQFTRIVLPNPRLHAVLRHNEKSILELPAGDDLRGRIESLFGGELARHLIDVESEHDGVRLWGYVAHPSQSKSTRKSQYLFLNGRWIQDRSLQHALSEAYRGILMVGRHPIAFLFLELPAEMVDVNVHPTKSEVRFLDGQRLYRQLLSTLRSRFLGMDLSNDLTVAMPRSPVPSTPVDPQRQSEVQQELISWAHEQLAAWTPTDDISDLEAAAEAHEQLASASADAAAPVDRDEPAPLPESPAPEMYEPSKPASSNIRAMQVHDCYLVVETSEGLSVIDQHALHERILYERLRERVLANRVEIQRLLMPRMIELAPREAGRLIDEQETLQQLGLHIEPMSGGTVALTAVPAMLGRIDGEELLRGVVEQLETTTSGVGRRDLLDRMLHMMSCKAAIKAGHRLQPEEITKLLESRHLVDDHHHCPHGRPTALNLSRAELDRQFGRLG